MNVILTKRATRAAGRISDSFAPGRSRYRFWNRAAVLCYGVAQAVQSRDPERFTQERRVSSARYQDKLDKSQVAGFLLF